MVTGLGDPRPHVGEPLPLDLLNTRWITPDGPADLLADVAGLQCWLAANGLDEKCAADDAARMALVFTRDAIERAVRAESHVDLNAVLDRGRVRRSLAESGPAEDIEVTPEWLASWLAADALLRLLDAAPGRIKQCAHPHCVLWFYDTSKNGGRRWHSMATCGNRVKAARHYAAKKP